jgi:predicted nuclease of predicted toxin-antitoxin system
MKSILADEGLNGQIVRSLREQGFTVDWVLEDQPGMSDAEIIDLAKARESLLITEDKDFGEWVFAHRISGLTIIFLRYDKEGYPTVLAFLTRLLTEYAEASAAPENEFIAINKNKVRRRKL